MHLCQHFLFIFLKIPFNPFTLTLLFNLFVPLKSVDVNSCLCTWCAGTNSIFIAKRMEILCLVTVVSELKAFSPLQSLTEAGVVLALDDRTQQVTLGAEA